MRKKRKRAKQKQVIYKNPIFITGCIIGFILLLYLMISVYFLSHFYFNTKINGKSFAGKSASSVQKHFKSQVEDYTLEISGQDGSKDTIKGTEISLQYEPNDEIEKALKKQNAFLWPASLFSSREETVNVGVSYDTSALDGLIQTLSAVTREQTPAENARPKLDGGQYVINPEVYGTAVNTEQLTETVRQYVAELKSSLDLAEEKCYALPRFTSESAEVKAACDEMNKCLQASITYPMNENVVVDKTLISQWLTVDDNMTVGFDNQAMTEWLSQFGDKYDTTGITRTFTTPTGKNATVSGGTYGWSIDEDTELVNLQNSIKNGEVVTREPAYYIGGTAAVHAMPDWGNTYIDVDLSAQHMWYIKDGNIALETDIVTGLPIPEQITPEGTYTILEISPDEVLIGETNPNTGQPIYRQPVSYWMRVTWSGIGFHDAIWQPAFGGNLYQTIGSHGCINMPVDQAAALFNMLEMGTPVVIHY